VLRGRHRTDPKSTLQPEEPDFSPQEGKNLKAKLFDGIAPDVVNAEHAWWYPEADPPDYRWKESCVNLLFGDDHIDPDTGAEPLKCYRCRVARV